MKKNLKLILFSLIFVFLCPVVFSACDELKFEDVPYVASSADMEEVIRDFNASGEYMVGNNLKIKLETINTYTFYDADYSKTRKRVIKDVITTSLGSTSDNPSIAIVDKVRYLNNKVQNASTQTYVRTTLPSSASSISYCYSYTKDYTGEEEIYDKDRNEYNSGSQNMISFFNSTIYQIKFEEVESIGEKEFEGTTYYRLRSGVNSLNAVNDRFVEDENLYNDPDLFKMLSKSTHDAVENYYYECAKNSSDYASYYAIHYDVSNGETEKYLSVSSITKLVKYGDAVTLSRPDDVDEYTANSFMKTMQKDNSYVIYSYTDDSDENSYNRTVWSVAKIGNDYSVRQDQYQANAIASTTYYYYVYIKDNDYKGYIINESEKKLIQTDLKLGIVSFDFTKSLSSKGDSNYQFGEDKSSTTISMQNEEIYYIQTNVTNENRNEEITLYISDFGNDYSSLTTRFITSLDEYSISM